MAAYGFDVVLFDLGGVLIRFGGVKAMRLLANIDSEEELWHKWLTCDWVRTFERGRCSPDDFATGLVADWELSVTSSEFLDQFRRWPEALHAGAEALVEELRGQTRVGCLSNTNALHWEQLAGWRLTEMFELRFLSHEMGLIKPDRAVFEHVAETLEIPPARIVFLDDNALNVDEARSVGFTAVQVRGVEESRSALIGLGLL